MCSWRSNILIQYSSYWYDETVETNLWKRLFVNINFLQTHLRVIKFIETYRYFYKSIWLSCEFSFGSIKIRHQSWIQQSYKYRLNVFAVMTAFNVRAHLNRGCEKLLSTNPQATYEPVLICHGRKITFLPTSSTQTNLIATTNKNWNCRRSNNPFKSSK